MTLIRADETLFTYLKDLGLRTSGLRSNESRDHS